MANPVVVVVGAGARVGASVGRAFGREGYDVALVARDQTHLDELGSSLQADGITTGWSAVDVADAPALAAAVDRFGGHAGHLDVLHVNTVALRAQDALTLTAQDLLDDLAVGVAPVLTVVQAARPYLRPGARVLVTGGSAADEPRPSAVSLGVQKAALRNLVMSLDASLAPIGVRAMSLTVAGSIAVGTSLGPDDVAGALLCASQRDDASWTTEVVLRP